MTTPDPPPPRDAVEAAVRYRHPDLDDDAIAYGVKTATERIYTHLPTILLARAMHAYARRYHAERLREKADALTFWEGYSWHRDDMRAEAARHAGEQR